MGGWANENVVAEEEADWRPATGGREPSVKRRLPSGSTAAERSEGLLRSHTVEAGINEPVGG